MQALLKRQSSSSGGDEAAVSSTMQVLEAIGQKSELLACKLMAHLSPVASEHRIHHVFDGIDLWWWHHKSPELSQYLLQFAAATI